MASYETTASKRNGVINWKELGILMSETRAAVLNFQKQYGTNAVNAVSIPRRITAIFTAQLGSSFGTKMARAVLVILAGKIMQSVAVLAVVTAGIDTSLTTHSAVATVRVVLLATLASAPVLMIQVVANTYRMHLVRAIAKRMILLDPKLGRYRAQEMVSRAKLAPWLELHPEFVNH